MFEIRQLLITTNNFRSHITYITLHLYKVKVRVWLLYTYVYSTLLLHTGYAMAFVSM